MHLPLSPDLDEATAPPPTVAVIITAAGLGQRLAGDDSACATGPHGGR